MISLKQITIEDLEFARRLRNKNRRYFFNSNYITQEENQAWFRKILQDNLFVFYIIWLEKRRIGTVSYKMNRNHAEIGNVLISNTYRGKGYFHKTMEVLLSLYPRRDVFVKVQPENSNAINVYLSLGFKERERILWK